MGYMELSSNWFNLKSDLQFTYDLITALLLFFLIQQFYKRLDLHSKKTVNRTAENKARIEKFIQLKRNIATVLIPVVILLAIYSFTHWIYVSYQSDGNDIATFKNINNIFFEDFFILLIIIDVILLLYSFFYSDSFHTIIRNSGFVISTILIKISFSVEGIINNALILAAVIFGYLILIIHNSYKNTDDVQS